MLRRTSLTHASTFAIFALTFVVAGLAVTTACSMAPKPPELKEREPTSIMTQSPLFTERVKLDPALPQQRVGYLLEDKNVDFKGCVLYLQGLGDSISNHAPYFNTLTMNGYRVLMFDYIGQGGSEGEMGETRVKTLKPSPFEIDFQARAVWDRYSKSKDPVFDRDCSQSHRMVIGWSTGGLAGYRMAYEQWAEAVVLIAPGIAPKGCVGESATNCTKFFGRVITERTLTRDRFENRNNPHLDEIRPTSPGIPSVLAFSTNLMGTSVKSRYWKIPSSITGLVFLSGVEDTYVYRDWTERVLKKNAPQFSIVKYDGALHELDNEIPEVSHDVHKKTLQFFDRFLQSRPRKEAL